MTGYTKLFGSIITSTIWRERNETRILWITMLALKNKSGVVEGSIPGLADMARLSLDDTMEALETLKAVDPFSRTKEHEGRRIQEVDGGWLILNHEKWRNKMNSDERREYLKVKQREHRARVNKSVNKRKQVSTPSTHSDADTYSDTEEVHPLTPSRGKCPSLKEAVDFLGSETIGTEFWDYYESNGWRVGRNPMKDWKAAARRWKRSPTRINNQQPLNFQDRKKRKEQFQEQLNAQFRSAAKDNAGRAIYTDEEKTERSRLYNEMEKL